MCGITGWVAYRRDLAAEQATVDAMTETMACRGPDARGTWWAPHVALGHRRLAVIDLPGGEQPMTVDVPARDGGTTTVGMVRANATPPPCAFALAESMARLRV